MRVETARAAAADWVAHHARPDPSFRGAFLSGSTTTLPGEADLPPASDVDIVVVTAGEEAAPKLGKFRYQDTLLEVTYLPWTQFANADEILATFYLAPSFRTNTIIADPTGGLHALHRHVARHFAQPQWIRQRYDDAHRRLERGLDSVDDTAPWHHQVTTWLFATSLTTHLVLIAALRNPTVRLRYLAAREALHDHGQAHAYPHLLDLLGCAHLTPERVHHHLRELARTFDAAAGTATTPFFFSTDITALARPIAIDASQHLIDTGRHHEAVFWIIATFARCHQILAADADPRLWNALTPAFHAAVADLGITTTDDLRVRADDVRRYLPELRDTTETILRAVADC